MKPFPQIQGCCHGKQGKAGQVPPACLKKIFTIFLEQKLKVVIPLDQTSRINSFFASFYAGIARLRGIYIS